VIRVRLPYQLCKLAAVEAEIVLSITGTPTQAEVIDAIEARFPELRGTMRDPASGKRRPYVRFFACEQDLSHQPLDTPLPDPVVRGIEAFHVVGAMSGG